MNIVGIVNAMIAADGGNIHIYRTFMDVKYSGCIAKRFTEIAEEHPQYTDLVMLMAVYPALKWTMKCKDISVLMENVMKTDKPINDLQNAQDLIVSASGLRPQLILKERQNYFSACEKVMRIIKSGVKTIGKFPGQGKIYRNCLLKVMHEREESGPKGQDMSRYMLNSYLPKAIELLYMQCHEALEPYMDIVLDGYAVDEDEITEQYHDIAALLLEYNKIMWYFKSSGDKAVRLLHCDTVEEMLEITEKDDKYYDAYLIAEYAKMISGAVELVKKFPIYGPKFYAVLRPMLDSPPQNSTVANMANEIGMSSFTYSVTKRKAMAVLGCALWGCDADTYIRLLTAPV